MLCVIMETRASRASLLPLLFLACTFLLRTRVFGRHVQRVNLTATGRSYHRHGRVCRENAQQVPVRSVHGDRASRRPSSGAHGSSRGRQGHWRCCRVRRFRHHINCDWCGCGIRVVFTLVQFKVQRERTACGRRPYILCCLLPFVPGSFKGDFRRMFVPIKINVSRHLAKNL